MIWNRVYLSTAEYNTSTCEYVGSTVVCDGIRWCDNECGEINCTLSGECTGGVTTGGGGGAMCATLLVKRPALTPDIAALSAAK